MYRLAALIGAPLSYLPTFGQTVDGGRPHIEFDGDAFHFVVVDRGRTLEHVRSTDPSENLYLVLDTITFTVALDRAPRPARQDFRVELFPLVSARGKRRQRHP